ncbi:hypothetical protein TNCV_2241081 [Trichonephila clavipes]|nr:hypothetical protein TNCV_2241081 [Trichonephila clavipes]
MQLHGFSQICKSPNWFNRLISEEYRLLGTLKPVSDKSLLDETTQLDYHAAVVLESNSGQGQPRSVTVTTRIPRPLSGINIEYAT